MAEVVLEALSKRFADGSLAVDGVNLHIHDGEFVVLVGPSGCGKSTTLNMVAGLESISSGRLWIDGVDVSQRAAGERDIAMVFQSYALYPHMSVRQNIAFPLMLKKVPKAQQAEKLQWAAELLDLTDLLDKKPAQLSGGQRQRVAMGRAIVRSPKVFLMDEPLSNLDAKLRVKMRAQIAALSRRLGTTTLYVTHDQTEAMTLGQRVVVLNRGVVQQVDTPKRLYQQPANRFVAGFLGTPSMGFVHAQLEDGRLHCELGSFVPPAALEKRLFCLGAKRELVLGIRAEHVWLVAPEREGLVFERKLHALESLGSDQYAYLQLTQVGLGPEKEPTLAARLAPDVAARVGDTLRFELDAEKILLFDAETGLNLER